MAVSLTCPGGPLARAVERVGKIVERRNTIPILGHLVLRAEGDGSLELVGTDLDIWATARLPAGAATVSEPGAVALPAALLADILKKCAGEIKITADASGQARLVSGRSSFRLQVLEPADMPEPGTVKPQARFEIAAAQLLCISESCAFAISTEETRYYLNGVFLHVAEPGRFSPESSLVAVATDGHRLSRLALPGIAVDGDMPPIIIPKKTVGLFDLLAKSAAPGEMISVLADEARIAFATESLTILSKLIDGTFPDYQRVIPAGNDRRALIDRTSLAAAVDRVSAISSERGRAVKLTFDGAGSLDLHCRSPDAGEASDAISAEGAFEPVEIGFNARYVADILGTFDVDTIRLSLADPGSPGVIDDPDDDTRLVVIMPMRI